MLGWAAGIVHDVFRQELSKERKLQEKLAREESNLALQARSAAALNPAARREELRSQALAIAEGMRAIREENERRYELILT